MSTKEERLKSGEVLIGADALDVAKDALKMASKHYGNRKACRDLAECIARAERSMGEQKISMTEAMQKALDDVGGEPLTGSGFENEKPETGFSDTAPAAAEPRQ